MKVSLRSIQKASEHLYRYLTNVLTFKICLGIQTEVNPQLSGQQDHWRAAMEHNKAVLASQENEMKEYLKRQQVSYP